MKIPCIGMALELYLRSVGVTISVHGGEANGVKRSAFGVNRLKLSEFGLAAEVGQINRAGARIARES